jgi:hypothetical protein
MSLFSALGKMALALLAMIGVGVASCEINKAYWDRQVRELCELDGGVVVYERVELTPEEYRDNDGKSGSIRVPSETSPLAKQYSYLRRTTTDYIRTGSPTVSRRESIIFRKSDGRELGRSVSYTRTGGSFPNGISETLSFSCNDIEDVPLDIERRIFSFRGE